ncbi:hypothetical protein JCM21900_003008 [Sporobolomyces salmonicolor]
MFSRHAAATLRQAPRQAPRLSRSYAQEGAAGPEPINKERGNSLTPFYIVGALVVLAGGYWVGVGQTPPTSSVVNMQKAMAPKTEEGKKAAGVSADPTDEPSKAGGDMKGRSA